MASTEEVADGFLSELLLVSKCCWRLYFVEEDQRKLLTP